MPELPLGGGPSDKAVGNLSLNNWNTGYLFKNSPVIKKKKNPLNYKRRTDHAVPAFLPCQTYFEDNPRDLQLLRHDLPLHPAVVKPHLGNVPDYLGEQGWGRAAHSSLGCCALG